MDETENHGKFLLVGITTIVIIVFIFLIGVVVVVMRSQTPPAAPAVSQVTEPGEIYLQPVLVKDAYSVGETYELDVFANSDGAAVVAYDVELLFEAAAEYVSAESLLPTFDISANIRPDGVYLTGFKKLGDQVETVLTGTPIARLTFMLKTPGTVTFAPQFVAGEKIHSNLVDTKNKNVLGKVEGVTIEVK